MTAVAAVPTRRRAASAALLALVFLWGATFVPVKTAVTGFPVLGFIGLRFFAALVALTPLGLIRLRHTFLTVRQIVQAACTGWIFLAGYTLQTFGLRYTAAGRAAFITGLSTILVPLMLVLLFGERLRVRPAVGAVLAVVGMTVLGLDGVVSGSLTGDLLVLGCAVAFAAHIIAMDRWGTGCDPLLFTLVQVAAVVPMSIVGSLLVEGPIPDIGPGVATVALFTGMIVTGGGLVVQVWAQRSTSPTHAAVIFATEPVFGALFGWLLAGETLTISGVLGSALILMGMLVAETG